MKRFTAAVGLIFALAWAPASMAAISGPVSTRAGLLEGFPGADPAVAVFRGIPYAAPPIGDLRWKAPAPPLAWQGVRKADQFGDDCTQPANGATRGHKISEDCLNLDLWTAASSPSERRPVMVWMHGGQGTGSASSPEFDGEALAKKGVVLVTVNYRLGVLSGLAAPDLDRDSGHNASGNYAVLDAVAALKWVRDNISAFGGDPKRVTLIGQSAGAGMVDYVSVTPLAKGLFQRAIAQSHVRYYKDPEFFALPTAWTSKADAEAQGVKFEQATGAHSLAEMRQIPWEKLIEISQTMPVGGVKKPAFVIDGYVIAHTNGDIFKRGLQNNVAYMAGDNRDESNAYPDTAFDLMTARARLPALAKLPDYLAWAHKMYGPMADEFLRLYPATSDREAFLSSGAASRDNAQVSRWMWAASWKQKGTRPVYLYLWTHAPPGPNHDLSGASHGSEIAYIYDHPTDAWTADDKRISDIMSSYWTNFAKTGSPNGPGLPKWPAFNGKAEQVMDVGDGFHPIPLADKAKIDFWKRFYATQPAG